MYLFNRNNVSLLILQMICMNDIYSTILIYSQTIIYIDKIK